MTAPVAMGIAERLGGLEAYGAAIPELCIEMGGTITGEHGVGIEKIKQMCSQFGGGAASPP